MKMRTFLVEDNYLIRENLVNTLEELAPVEAIGMADSEEEGAAWLNGHAGQWDLAIVDLFLKQGSGLGILAACRLRHERQRVVVFSNYPTSEMRLRCAQLGADAVFDKSTEIGALVTYCAAQSDKLKAQVVPVMYHTPSVPEPAPGTYIPTEIPPLGAPSGPDQPPEIDQPPPAQPTIPIRDPGFGVPVQAARVAQ